MKKLFFIFLLACGNLAAAQDFPPQASPPRLVNDFADVLGQDEEARLEQKLVAFDDSTSTQLAVVFTRSVGGYDITQYGDELAENGGSGQADKRNGLLLFRSETHRVGNRVGSTVRTGRWR